MVSIFLQLNHTLETHYTVTTKTGSVTGAGTDANVAISMFGDKNKIVKHAMKTPEGGWNPFEGGATDSFKFNEIDVGQVRPWLHL